MTVDAADARERGYEPGFQIDDRELTGELTPAVDTSSALAILNGYLAEIGLASLGAKVWQWYKEGRSDAQIRLDIRDTPEHAARFPGFKELQRKGRAISEATWIGAERQMVSTMRAYGLPSDFYDQPNDLAKFITGETSPREFESRVALASALAFDAPTEVRGEFNRLFGAQGHGALTSLILDPDVAEPVLRKQYAAAQLSGSALRTGFGGLTAGEATRLADLGLSESDAAGGFSQLTAGRELFTALPGEDQFSISREEQLAAGLEGNVAAQNRITRRAETRRARFSGGGGFTETRQGFTGLGAAP